MTDLVQRLRTHLGPGIGNEAAFNAPAAAMLRKQDADIKMLRAALGVIAWSNDSKWQSDAAKEALAATEEFQE